MRKVMVRLQVKLLPGEETFELEFPGKVRVEELVRRLGFPVEGVVVVKDGDVIPEDEVLSEDGQLTVYLTSSGG